jgi:hypothetical protein
MKRLTSVWLICAMAGFALAGLAAFALAIFLDSH